MLGLLDFFFHLNTSIFLSILSCYLYFLANSHLRTVRHAFVCRSLRFICHSSSILYCEALRCIHYFNKRGRRCSGQECDGSCWWCPYFPWEYLLRLLGLHPTFGHQNIVGSVAKIGMKRSPNQISVSSSKSCTSKFKKSSAKVRNLNLLPGLSSMETQDLSRKKVWLDGYFSQPTYATSFLPSISGRLKKELLQHMVLSLILLVYFHLCTTILNYNMGPIG